MNTNFSEDFKTTRQYWTFYRKENWKLQALVNLTLNFISQILICSKRVQFCLQTEDVPQKPILAFHCTCPRKGSILYTSGFINYLCILECNNYTWLNCQSIVGRWNQQKVLRQQTHPKSENPLTRRLIPKFNFLETCLDPKCF